MDRDSFIIAVFLLVCEQYDVISQQYRLRRGGFEAALKDEEIIAMEICGEYLSLECDRDTFVGIICTFSQNLLTYLCLSDRQQTYCMSSIQKQLITISGQSNDPVISFRCLFVSSQLKDFSDKG